MTPKDRETIQRALGIIEGILYSGNIPEDITKNLWAVVGMIDEVMDKEEPT